MIVRAAVTGASTTPPALHLERLDVEVGLVEAVEENEAVQPFAVQLPREVGERGGRA